MDLLKNVSFGKHYFEIAKLLRETMFVNGLLTNCEAWHNLKESEIAKLEEVDRLLIRKLFQVQSSCPTEASYLELGCIPLGIMIKSRRLNYLHHLVTRDKEEMISQISLHNGIIPQGVTGPSKLKPIKKHLESATI